MTKTILHLLLLGLVFDFVLIANGLAETGDELVISGDIVNIRIAPSIDSEVATSLPRGERLIEIQRQRQGEWVEIDTGRKDIRTGWVHQSLVSKSTEATKIGAQGGATSIDLFNNFMQIFKDRKESITNQVGDMYFANAIFKSETALEIIATETWLNAGTEERHDALSKVLYIWNDVNQDANSISVRVYDVHGEQHMTMILH